MVEDLLKEASLNLSKVGIDTPRLDAEVLLAATLGISREMLYMDLKRELSEEEVLSFKSIIKRRERHEPVAYIIGRKEFMSIDFEVNPHVLIPRPETELLVEEVMKRLHKGARVIDIGTGCGNIAITLAVYLDCLVYAIDSSFEAIRVASKNAKRIGVTNRVHLINGRVLTSIKPTWVDAIVSNPPYVPTSEWEGLPIDIKGFEPRGAIDGGMDGLDLHKEIISTSYDHLKEGGFLALEIGGDQADRIIKIFRHNRWSSFSIIKDHHGVDRVAIAWKG